MYQITIENKDYKSTQNPKPINFCGNIRWLLNFSYYFCSVNYQSLLIKYLKRDSITGIYDKLFSLIFSIF